MWLDVCKNRDGDSRYGFRQNFEFPGHLFTTVPLTTKDDRKTTIFSYSPRGIRNFFPWKLFPENPASYEGLLKALCNLLPYFDLLITRHQYPFFRLDISLWMSFFRVSAYPST